MIFPRLLLALALVPQVQSYRISGRQLPCEGYRMRIAADGRVEVSSADAAGAFYARKTLKQLGTVMRRMEIEDWPAYRWRGIHLDESRHFFGKEYVKRLIRRMADYKFNILHWHLMDESGWRLEIPRYPEVARSGAVRTMKKGGTWIRDVENGVYGPFFYTADDVREVLAVAKENFVTVVPEIEMPGHAWIILNKCYPHFACNPKDPGGVFCLGNDEGLKFLEKVIDYVADVFPGPYVHIGGDEVDRSCWSKCERCQSKARELGLVGTDMLQNWATHQFAVFLSKKGKRAIGWDEIADGPDLPQSVVVMDWCGKGRGPRAAASGHDVVLCHHEYCYLDYTQGLKEDPIPYRIAEPCLPLEKVYSFDIDKIIPEEYHARILGGQCCNWTEFTCTPEELEWKLWPRAYAVAENLWTAPKHKDFAEFIKRLESLRLCIDKGNHWENVK